VTVGKRVFTRGSETQAELAAREIGSSQISPLDQVGKESLNQVRRFVPVEPLLSDEGMMRIPVVLAKPL
jgi:hypothetical protein